MYSFFKPIIDFVAALLVLLLLLPVMGIIALIIFMQDFHNPVFSHQRIGRNENSFTFYKFRSMPVNTTNVESHEYHKIRITPFGRILRRTNLDELPQLFSIIAGDMSLIGPRPPISTQKSLIQLRRENGSIKLKPGLTGWAQVNSYDNMPDYVKAEFDGYYYQNLSFAMDVKIIFKTLAYLTKPPPAY